MQAKPRSAMAISSAILLGIVLVLTGASPGYGQDLYGSGRKDANTNDPDELFTLTRLKR